MTPRQRDKYANHVHAMRHLVNMFKVSDVIMRDNARRMGLDYDCLIVSNDYL